MIPEVATLVRLQELDAQTAQLQKRLNELPKLLAAEKLHVEELKRALDALEARKSANEQEQRKLSGETELRQTKIKRLKQQIQTASNDTQFQAFQHEIDFAEAENAKADDRTLSLMEELEKLEANLVTARRAFSELQQTRLHHLQAAEKEHKAGLAQLAENATAHKGLIGSLDAPNRALYERLRKKYKTGAIVAEVADGHCEECRMALRLAYWQQIKAAPDRLYQCEDCGRVLHYNRAIDDSHIP